MNRGSRIFAIALAASLACAARAEERVLVVPFNVLNVPASQQWIAKGVQENLIADLGRSGDFDPISFGGQVIVEDNATAARLARTINAPLAIRGSAQAVGNELRLTAQLIDARSGDTVRTALVTGAASELLKLEDQLARQIRGIDVKAPATATAAPPAAVTPILIAPPQPQVIVISQPQPTYYPTYYPNYAGYPYGYRYGYPPLILYQVNPGHPRRGGDHDDHNGGRDHGGGGMIVHHDVYDPTGLPIPSGGNLLPIPTGNVLPIPTGRSLLPIPTRNIQPLPTNNVPVMTHLPTPTPANSALPVPASAPPVPRTNAGQNRNPRMVN